MTRSSEKLAGLISGDWRLFKRKGKRDSDKQLPEDLGEIGNFLLSRRGEASGTVLAERLLDRFDGASVEERETFFRELESDFGVDREAVGLAIDAYRNDENDVAANALHAAAEPRRQELFRRLNYSPDGTRKLIRMREFLLELIKSEPGLKVVDSDFVHLFTSWFNPGFLQLEPINWNTSANVLEKLIKYEAVHKIHGWDDLRRRLNPYDRRCFGFFHPRLKDEPLIFVEVAFTRGVADSIQKLLNAETLSKRPDDFDTAIFYSISSTQRGLAGVPFGSFLLKHVIEFLTIENSKLSKFVTLSPIPGFAKWLKSQRADPASSMFNSSTLKVLGLLDEDGWEIVPEKANQLRPILSYCAATYLTKAKNKKGRPMNPVARFHLRNGASVFRVNFLADTSVNGMTQSHGMMVNYMYIPEDIEQNHEGFVERNEIAMSNVIEKLVAEE